METIEKIIVATIICVVIIGTVIFMMRPTFTWKRTPNYNALYSLTIPNADSEDGNTKFLGSVDNVDQCEKKCSDQNECKYYIYVSHPGVGSPYDKGCWGGKVMSPIAQDQLGVFSGEKIY
jgi:hypothetical protein